MQSQDRHRVALLAAYAIALHGFEALIPLPVPWLRLGLANIVTLATLLVLGFRAALFVTLIRVFLASVFTGTFLGPAFLLSLSGGLAGTLAMGLAAPLTPRVFGTVGLSLIGALFHNLAQLTCAYVLFIGNIKPVLIVAPVLVLIGAATGFVNGLATDLLVRSLKNITPTVQNIKP